jgi:hypothetical protein
VNLQSRKLGFLFKLGQSITGVRPSPLEADVRGKRMARIEWALKKTENLRPGLIVECGVGAGISLLQLIAGEKFLAENIGSSPSKVIGFDTFTGFPDGSEVDSPKFQGNKKQRVQKIRSQICA